LGGRTEVEKAQALGEALVVLGLVFGFALAEAESR
jgi:hypothetical protein